MDVVLGKYGTSTVAVLPASVLEDPGRRQARGSGASLMPVFDRGDVVSVPLDPAIGHEQPRTRPALVSTTRDFNEPRVR
jgi:hypothetical protein